MKYRAVPSTTYDGKLHWQIESSFQVFGIHLFWVYEGWNCYSEEETKKTLEHLNGGILQ